MPLVFLNPTKTFNAMFCGLLAQQNSTEERNNVVSNFDLCYDINMFSTEENTEYFRKTIARMNHERQSSFFDILENDTYIGSGGFVKISRLQKDTQLVFVIDSTFKDKMYEMLECLLDRMRNSGINLNTVVCRLCPSGPFMSDVYALLIQLNFTEVQSDVVGLQVLVYDLYGSGGAGRSWQSGQLKECIMCHRAINGPPPYSFRDTDSDTVVHMCELCLIARKQAATSSNSPTSRIANAVARNEQRDRVDDSCQTAKLNALSAQEKAAESATEKGSGSPTNRQQLKQVVDSEVRAVLAAGPKSPITTTHRMAPQGVFHTDHGGQPMSGGGGRGSGGRHKFQTPPHVPNFHPQYLAPPQPAELSSPRSAFSGSTGGGNSSAPCVYWQRGYCMYGSTCRFSHAQEGAQQDSTAIAAGSAASSSQSVVNSLANRVQNISMAPTHPAVLLPTSQPGVMMAQDARGTTYIPTSSVLPVLPAPMSGTPAASVYGTPFMPSPGSMPPGLAAMPHQSPMTYYAMQQMQMQYRQQLAYMQMMQQAQAQPQQPQAQHIQQQPHFHPGQSSFPHAHVQSSAVPASHQGEPAATTAASSYNVQQSSQQQSTQQFTQRPSQQETSRVDASQAATDHTNDFGEGDSTTDFLDLVNTAYPQWLSHLQYVHTERSNGHNSHGAPSLHLPETVSQKHDRIVTSGFAPGDDDPSRSGDGDGDGASHDSSYAVGAEDYSCDGRRLAIPAEVGSVVIAPTLSGNGSNGTAVVQYFSPEMVNAVVQFRVAAAHSGGFQTVGQVLSAVGLSAEDEVCLVQLNAPLAAQYKAIKDSILQHYSSAAPAPQPGTQQFMAYQPSHMMQQHGMPPGLAPMNAYPPAPLLHIPLPPQHSPNKNVSVVPHTPAGGIAASSAANLLSPPALVTVSSIRGDSSDPAAHAQAMRNSYYGYSPAGSTDTAVVGRGQPSGQGGGGKDKHRGRRVSPQHQIHYDKSQFDSHGFPLFANLTDLSGVKKPLSPNKGAGTTARSSGGGSGGGGGGGGGRKHYASDSSSGTAIPQFPSQKTYSRHKARQQQQMASRLPPAVSLHDTSSLSDTMDEPAGSQSESQSAQQVEQQSGNKQGGDFEAKQNDPTTGTTGINSQSSVGKPPVHSGASRAAVGTVTNSRSADGANKRGTKAGTAAERGGGGSVSSGGGNREGGDPEEVCTLVSVHSDGTLSMV